MSNSMTMSKMSGFFVSTAWSSVYLQKVASKFQSSKVNLPKYFETYKSRCFTTYPDFVSSPLFAGKEKKSVGKVFRQCSDEKTTKKKTKQIGQEKVALTITGAGVVARKWTFSNKISELLYGAPPLPRWHFHYITVRSHAAGLSRTVIMTAVVDRTGDTVKGASSHVCWRSKSKVEWQHLKRSLTPPRRAMLQRRNKLQNFLFLFTQPAVWARETWYSVVWTSQSTS